METKKIMKKSKITAGILALLLGALGIHKFYLDKPAIGVLYLLMTMTMILTIIPLIISLIEGIVYLTMSKESFQKKYGETPDKQCKDCFGKCSIKARKCLHCGGTFN